MFGPTKFLAVAQQRNLKLAFDVLTGEQSSDIEAPILVCIPSLGDTKSEYRLLRPLLAKKGFTSVAIDHRGLGESDVGFTSHKPEDCGQDLLLLLDQPEIRGKPVVLIGNSFGGAAAVWAAAERPSQIKGIVLVDAFVRDHPMPFGVPTLLRSLLNRWTGPSFWATYYKSLYTIQPSPVSDLKEYCKTLKVNLKERGRIEAVREQIFASKANCEARLPAIRSLPALVIFGDKDPDFPQPKGPETEAQWIQSKFETGRHIMIEGAGHYPQVESAAAVANHIVEFLSTLRIV